MPAKGNAFEKRVHRRITGRTHSFFVVTAPGLEALCRREILALSIPREDVRTEKGGVLFQGRVHDCYRANLFLRTAGRILMRITDFKATNFRQLRKKIHEIEWELYLRPGASVQIHVAVKHSRLFHTDAVRSHFMDAVALRMDTLSLAGQGVPGDGVPQSLYVRVVDDVVTVSLDSSGEILYKRGLKAHYSRAPVRETIAAAVLRLAGYTGDTILVDPMCGSGTFSLEGAMIANRIPAGWYRTFAFEGWPCFRPEMWNFIRREASEKILSPQQIIIHASDVDEQACRKLNDAVQTHDFQQTVSVAVRDFFSLSQADFGPKADSGRHGVMVINPPYGKRMGSPDDSRKLLHRILKKISCDFPGWRFALTIPQVMIGNIPDPPMEIHPVYHGGINLAIALGRA